MKGAFMLRKNIGLLIDDLNTPFTAEAVKGAELGARAVDANMYIFPGMYLDNTTISDDHLQFEYQYNTLFQFANDNHLDILYIMMGMIGCRVNLEERRRFLSQFLGIPVVILYTDMPGYPSMIFDNQGAFMHGIRHLIVDHGAKKIGFVSGPKTNIDAMERFHAYKKVLEEQNIPYNDNYVVYGNFEDSSEKLIGAFVATHPNLDAIVFANDQMASGGYRVFAKLGIKVGKDILVMGFDNAPFASTLNPPLTTVEANAAELSYKAVAHMHDFLKETDTPSVQRVDTHFIHRCSCGCSNYDYDTLATTLHLLDLLDDTKRPEVMKHVMNYLFSTYASTDAILQLKDDLCVLFRLIADLTTSSDIKTDRIDIQTLFTQIIEQPIFSYTSVEFFINLLCSLQFVLERQIQDADKRIAFVDIFSSMYQQLSLSNFRSYQKQYSSMAQITHLVDEISANLSLSKLMEIPFDSILKNMSSIGVHSSFLYTFKHPINHPRDTVFRKPDSLLLRAYTIENKSYAVPKNEQLVTINSLFHNARIRQDQRRTYVVVPLFSQEQILGLIVCDTEREYFNLIPSLATHISAALKTMLLLEQQQEISEHLQQNLEQLSKHNLILKEISKTDQLTGLYNRWGFLDYVKTIIENPMNQNREVLVLYADMDNLKSINDVYGHDEGDFALREIGHILKEAFRNTDVISRFGGDEFVAFALLGIPNYGKIMKHRIAEITERHNQMVQKPYRIEMSIGICEVRCSKDLDIDEVLELADKQLYLEKKAKKEKRK